MQIRFVCKTKELEEVSELSRLAFAVLQEANLNPEWISEKDCLDLKERNSDVFVCDPFSGSVFDHLKRLRYRILGPRCVTYCMEMREALPKLPYPVYSATMKGVVVCCTSIEKKTRLELHEKIQLMGGEVSGNLTSSVTRLVAEEVGSKKYHVACGLKKPVMLPAWVHECWKIGLDKNVHATNAMFDELKCPIFKGLHITVSQVDAEERRKIQTIVNNNGGKYSGELRANDTTHLIAVLPEGQKYLYARQWKIYCITASWLYDSLDKGFCMDEVLYKLNDSTNNTKTSTPNTSALSKSTLRSLPNTSCISNASMNSRINETVRSDVCLFNKSVVQEVSVKSLRLLETLRLSDVSKAGNFLDGCKIFFSGFSEPHLEKLRKVVNVGGGTRFSQICDSVSHVVINPGTKEHIQITQNLQVRPFIVSVDWLIQSCTIGRQAEETPFLILDPNEPDDQAIVDGPQKASKPSKPSNPASTSANNGSIYDDEVMSQYLQKSSLALEDEIFLKVAQDELASNPDDATNAENDHIEPLEGDPEVEEEENADNDGLFTGMTFVIFGFDNEDASLIEEMVTENNGNVLSVHDNDKAIIITQTIHFAVVPLLGYTVPLSVNEIVTNYWVQICLEKGECLPLTDNEIFRPVNVNMEAKPLSECVLSISQYSGTERDALVCLAEILGATYQEFFVRKANANSNLVPSTHLICMTADGSKYKGAANWGLPAVTKEWLFACANVGYYVSEEIYLVGSTQASKTHRAKEAPEDETEKSVTDCPNDAAGPSEKEDSSTKEVTLNTTLSQPAASQLLNNKKENRCTPAKRAFTPARTHRPQVCRIKELIQEDRVSRPVSPENAGVNTPGKFLNPAIMFKPSFDFTEVDQILNSPSNNDASRRRSSISVEDWLGVNLQQALTQSQQKCNTTLGKPTSKGGPLSAVIMCVSKKLTSEQGELNDIATALGGVYRWMYDAGCTHFVYRGKSGDASRELKIAREQGKKIVSPDWLYACNENNKLEDEELYPFTYNANMTLEVKPTRLNLRSKSRQNTTLSVTSKSRDLTNVTSDSDRSTVECNSSLNSCSPSKDNQASVNRQMELMLATKTDKGNKKRKQASSPFAQPAETRLGNAQVRNDTPSRKKEGAPEVPNSVPITWDDPTGRQEREKLAEQLAKESQSLSPAEQQLDKDDQNLNLQATNQVRASNGSNKENDDQPVLTTVRSPALAVLDNSVVKIAPRLMFSGMTNKDRIEYAAVVIDMGGSVSDGQHFDKNCTHLVVHQPSRNEKFLASVAAGKWIVHKSYLQACLEQRRFVDESLYEWGGNEMLKKIPITNAQLLKLAESAHRWRCKLNPTSNKICPETLKAFHGWNAIVYTDQQRESSFRRLLEAGGATIVQAQFPFSDPKNANFAFLELSKARSEDVDLQALLDHRVKCLRPDYIAAYLTDEPAPPVQNFFIPEVKNLLTEEEGDTTFHGKRKSDSNMPQRTKKSRR